MSPEMYGLLITDCGWKATRWQTFVTQLVATAVLDPAHTVDGEWLPSP